jgi:hypothetical protein
MGQQFRFQNLNRNYRRDEGGLRRSLRVALGLPPPAGRGIFDAIGAEPRKGVAEDA